jgi:hypothetical protein
MKEDRKTGNYNVSNCGPSEPSLATQRSPIERAMGKIETTVSEKV